MKKLLLLTSIFFSAMLVKAAALPEPEVMVLPQNYGWFDAFAVTWAQNPTKPYSLEIVDPSGVSVVKNLVENIRGLDVSLVEYQEDENTPNYPNARLLVTLPMIETDVNAYYNLNIKAGAINVNIDGTKVPNEEVSYSFQLLVYENSNKLPEPNMSPEPGNVAAFSVVEMSWTGKLGILDILNPMNQLNPDSENKEVTLTNQDGEISYPSVSFKWSSRSAMTDGSAGDIMVITLSAGQSLPEGKYVLTIPADYLQISDVETGTLYNEEMVFEYTVVSDDFNGIGEVFVNESEETGVYDLNGVRIPDYKTGNLPAGIYVINGKKVIIK